MDTNSFDFNNQPYIAKLIEICLLCIATVSGGGYYFFISNKNQQLAAAEQQENELKQDIRLKQAQMMNLGIYKNQIEETEVALSLQLQQLPTKSEVAELLSDISRVGLANDIVFDSFKPGAIQESRELDFYAELPLTIKLTGTYNQIGHFISELSSLPRIVTLHDFTIYSAKVAEGKEKTGIVTMEIVVKTYSYSN